MENGNKFKKLTLVGLFVMQIFIVFKLKLKAYFRFFILKLEISLVNSIFLNFAEFTIKISIFIVPVVICYNSQP